MADVSKAIIDTLIAEAGGEGQESMRRVAETILNRAAIRGLTPDQVVTQPYQYAGYSNPGPLAVEAQQNPRVRTAAEAAWQLATQPGDPTGGADHYFNPNIVQPAWARGMTPTGSYGGHAYYASRPIPPGEIENAVGTALSVVPTPTPVTPVTISPDLAQMRDPRMSTSARAAQVTPTGDVPLPRRRPSAPDIVTPSMASVARTRNMGDSLALSPIRGGAQTSPLFDASYDTRLGVMRSIDPAPTAGVGWGTSAPTPATMSPHVAALRARDLDLQMALNQKFPPTRLPPLPAEGQGNLAARNAAARIAALTANQSYVERTPTVRPRTTPIPQSYAGQEGTQLLRNARLATPGIPLVTNVGLNQAPIQVVAPQRLVPVPQTMSAGLQASRLPAPLPAAPITRPAQAASSSAPLRVVVNGANSYSAPQPLTAVQSLQRQGLSPSDAYALANANAARESYERANGTDTRSDWFRSVTGG